MNKITVITTAETNRPYPGTISEIVESLLDTVKFTDAIGNSIELSLTIEIKQQPTGDLSGYVKLTKTL